MANIVRPGGPAGFIPEGGDEYVREPSSFLKIWRVIWLNRWIVVSIVLTCLTIALVATLLATPQYTSTARVQVNRVTANVSNVEGVQPEGTVLDYDEFYNTQYSLLESVSLAERVARVLNLAGDDLFLE